MQVIAARLPTSSFDVESQAELLVFGHGVAEADTVGAEVGGELGDAGS